MEKDEAFWSIVNDLVKSNSIGFPSNFQFTNLHKTADEVNCVAKLFHEKQQCYADLLEEELDFIRLLGAAESGLPCLFGSPAQNAQIFDMMASRGRKLNLITECYE